MIQKYSLNCCWTTVYRIWELCGSVSVRPQEAVGVCGTTSTRDKTGCKETNLGSFAFMFSQLRSILKTNWKSTDCQKNEIGQFKCSSEYNSLLCNGGAIDTTSSSSCGSLLGHTWFSHPWSPPGMECIVASERKFFNAIQRIIFTKRLKRCLADSNHWTWTRCLATAFDSTADRPLLHTSNMHSVVHNCISICSPANTALSYLGNSAIDSII